MTTVKRLNNFLSFRNNRIDVLLHDMRLQQESGLSKSAQTHYIILLLIIERSFKLFKHKWCAHYKVN